MKMLKNKHFKFIIRSIAMLIAAVVYAFFFKVIVEGRGFLAMGASGVAVIASRLLGTYANSENLVSVFYMILYMIINVPIIIFGFKTISKKFILLTLIYVVSFSVTVALVPENLGEILGFTLIDNATSAVLIGLISGVSCAISFMLGGCAGGVDIISAYLNIKKGKSIGIYNLIFNAIVLFIGLLVFKDVASIIYTLIYAFVSSVVLDKYYNRNRKVMLEIITNKKDEVCTYLMHNYHHGCTVLPAKGAYTNEDKYAIHTVISSFQLRSVSKSIKKIDEKSFIINLDVNHVVGEFYMPPIN